MGISSESHDTRDLYLALMAEIKKRLDIIDSLIRKKMDLLGKIPRTEFCYLELRMICECIALACLVAHGDVKGARSAKIRDTTKADLIIAALTKLHPSFYPRPQLSVKRVGPNDVVVTGLHTGFMTQRELVKLYTTCGKHLHRGSLKSFKALRQADMDFEPIIAASKKIHTLLRIHAIVLAIPKTSVLVSLGEPGEVPNLSVLQKIDELPQ